MKEISGKTLGLIGLITLIVIILIVISVRINPGPQPNNNPNPTPSYHADATLELQLTQLGATIGTTTIPSEMYVNVNSVSNHIRGAQFSINYNPKYLTNVEIKPGPYLTNPSELGKKLDQVHGKIDYAVAIKPGAHASTGKGPIAIISFKLSPGVTGTTTLVSFTGQSIIISADTLANVFASSTNASIPLPKQ